MLKYDVEKDFLEAIEKALVGSGIKPSHVLRFIEPVLEKLPGGAGEERRLIEATRDLVQYRAQAGPLNFQLEKADHFLRTLHNILEAMGEAGSIRKIW